MDEQNNQVVGSQVSENEPVEEVEEPSGSDSRSFDQLSDDEQIDILKGAFFSEEEGEDDGSDTGEDGEGEGETEEEEAEEKEDSAEAAQESQAQPYTADEYLLLDPTEVDVSRLPKAARIVHEQNMKYYNQVIAPQLAQLKQLQEQANGKAQQSAPAEAPAQNTNAFDFGQFKDQVKAEAARRLGVEDIDEFNADHQIMVSLVSNEIISDIHRRQNEQQAMQNQFAQRQQNYNTIMSDLRNEYGSDFAIIDKWALEQMDNLPYSVHQKVLAELNSGDINRVKQVYKEFASKYKEAHGKPAKKAPAAPPRLMGGSRSIQEPHGGWGISDFRNASRDDQRRMIAEKFFK